MRFWRRTGPARPGPQVEAAPAIGEVAVLGSDLPGLRPRFAVAEGETVAAGQRLLVDRRRPEIAVTAPVAGTVRSIRPGPRGRLGEVVIACGDGGSVPAEIGDPRRTMLAAGLWTGFRTRPFGLIPDPEAQPEAIFVTATPDDPAAPDPRPVIGAEPEAFAAGVAALGELTAGCVHLCQTPGPDLLPQSGRLRTASFAGRHAGAASAHVERLHPVAAGRQVWVIGYADVLTLGRLLLTRELRPERVVAVTGAAVERPRLVRVAPGCSLRDLVRPMVSRPGAVAVLVGATAAARPSAWLGARDLLVTVAPPPPRREAPARLRPIIPAERLEGVLPIRTHAVPLMRALTIQDVAAAERLGCLGLVEEDVAPLNALCTSGARYDLLLRQALDRIAAAG